MGNNQKVSFFSPVLKYENFFIFSTKTSKDKKEQSIQKLLELCSGKLKTLIYSHGTSRVVQCLYALKRPEIQQIIFDELKPEIAKMAESVYAKFLVSKMLKYG
jgi:hypothetical protein